MVYNEMDWNPDGTPAGDEDLNSGFDELQELGFSDLVIRFVRVVFFLAVICGVLLTTFICVSK